MNTKESKHSYVKPAMRVHELKHKSAILVGSLKNAKGASMTVEYEEEDI